MTNLEKGASAGVALLLVVLVTSTLSLRSEVKSLNDKFDKIISRAMAKDPDDRYKSISGLLKDLQQAKSQQDCN